MPLLDYSEVAKWLRRITSDSAMLADTGLDTLGGAGGAPTDATYLTATANGTLSAEVVVGATPGGELGGTWASPTVDATHSGSTHAATQAAAEATAAGALSSHEADTTSIHGIADTANLVLTNDARLSDARTPTSHGDASHSALNYEASGAVATHAATTHLALATNAIVLGSAAAAGAAGTTLRSNDTIAAFDATNPSTQAFGDAAAVGAAAFAARRDHKHEMMANPVTAHEAASDPHTGYLKENDASWTDLTDAGETTLHTHPAAAPAAHDIDGALHNGFPGGTSTFLRADGAFAAPTATVLAEFHIPLIEVAAEVAF